MSTPDTQKDGKKETRRIISSGNVELDSKMGGGLPSGSLTLIEGMSGAGKSVLTQQIVFGGLKTGYTAALFTTENTVKSMVTQMQSIDLDILDFLLLGRLRVYPVELSQRGAAASASLLTAMKRETSGAERKSPRDIVIVDSFTAAMTRAGNDTYILSFFEECKRLCANGATILITMHAQAVSIDLLNPLRSMCDAHLLLRSEQDGQRIVKTLQVAKIRGAASGTGAIVGFDVEPGWGMRVIPISKARG